MESYFLLKKELIHLHQILMISMSDPHLSSGHEYYLHHQLSHLNEVSFRIHPIMYCHLRMRLLVSFVKVLPRIHLHLTKTLHLLGMFGYLEHITSQFS